VKRQLFRLAAFDAPGLLLLASLPFMLDIVSYGKGWINESLGNVQKHLEEFP
jgi:hypothetical protein